MSKNKNPKFIKKVAKFLAELTLVIGLMLVTTQVTTVARSLLPENKEFQEILMENQIPVPPAGDTGQETFKKFVLGGLAYVKILTVVVGILYITIMAFTLVSEGHTEDQVSNARKGLLYALLAFIMISMAEDIGKIFDMEKSSLLESPQEILNRVHLFDKQVEIFVTFVKYVIGAYATLMLVRHGVTMVTSGDKEEEAKKSREGVLYSAGGLLLIYIGDIFINKVFYKVDKNSYSGITGVHPSIDTKEGVNQLVGITNFVVSFVGPVAVVMLIIAAVMYASAGSNEEQGTQAKRILTATIIGVVIIFGAFAVVSTVISGRLQDMGTLID
ncbi:MAG: pilin [Patescibacteria group bacterium]